MPLVCYGDGWVNTDYITAIVWTGEGYRLWFSGDDDALDLDKDEFSRFSRLEKHLTSKAEGADEWIQWVRPLPPSDAEVEVEYRDGIRHKDKAGAYDWSIGNEPNNGDIVRFRYIRQETP